MNEKMAAFKYIVQCFKCNCLLLKKIEKTVIFLTTKPAIMQKTCHYLDNLDNVPKPFNRKSLVHLLISNVFRQLTKY